MAAQKIGQPPLCRRITRMTKGERGWDTMSRNACERVWRGPEHPVIHAALTLPERRKLWAHASGRLVPVQHAGAARRLNPDLPRGAWYDGSRALTRGRVASSSWRLRPRMEARGKGRWSRRHLLSLRRNAHEPGHLYPSVYLPIHFLHLFICIICAIN